MFCDEKNVKKASPNDSLSTQNPSFSDEFYKDRAMEFLDKVFWNCCVWDECSIIEKQVQRIFALNIEDELLRNSLLIVVSNPENAKFKESIDLLLKERLSVANLIIHRFNREIANLEIDKNLNVAWIESLGITDQSYSILHRASLFFARMVKEHYTSGIRKILKCYTGEPYDYEQLWLSEMESINSDEFARRLNAKFSDKKRLNIMLIVESRAFAQEILVALNGHFQN
jgi:hypothetical protein